MTPDASPISRPILPETMSDHTLPWSEFTLPGARASRLTAQANGAIYDISVWCPETVPSGPTLPVIYVLDGHDFFGTCVDSVRRMARRPDATDVHAAMVVAITPVAAPGANSQRHLDFTPGPPAEEPAGERRSGGADAFLAFLRNELMPYIEREFPADSGRRILFGHSLAGFFALHVLATQPDSFADYVTISPSIWWNEAALRAGLELMPLRDRRVFIAVGQWEGELPPWQRQHKQAAQIVERRARRAMPQRARRLAAHLGNGLGPARVAFHQFPDEDHASVVLVALARALRFVL